MSIQLGKAYFDKTHGDCNCGLKFDPKEAGITDDMTFEEQKQIIEASIESCHTFKKYQEKMKKSLYKVNGQLDEDKAIKLARKNSLVNNKEKMTKLEKENKALKKENEELKKKLSMIQQILLQ